MINVVEKKMKIILLKKYQKFVNVFNKQNANKLSQHDCFNYAIKIEKKSFFEFIYNLSITKLKIFKKYINDNWKKNYNFIIIISKNVYFICFKVKWRFAFLCELQKFECHY